MITVITHKTTGKVRVGMVVGLRLEETGIVRGDCA